MTEGVRQRRNGRRRRESGAALVEFAFVMIPLFILLFGIIVFGLLLSFKQDLTAAVNNAANAASFVPTDQDTAPADGTADIVQEAEDALERSVNAYDRSCDDPDDGLTCEAHLVDCDATVEADDCLEVTIEFDNTGETSFLPELPLVSSFIPDTLTATATVETFRGPGNPPS